MRKILTFLFAALMSVGMWATPIIVEWNDPAVSGDSFTQDGVTFTCSDANLDYYEKIFYGPGTFTTTLGNFTRIEVYVEEGCYFDGDGWSGGKNHKTWTGNAASVSWGDGDAMIYAYGGTSITFVFTIEPASAPEPGPEPAGNTVTWDNTNVFNAANSGVELSKWNPDPLTFEGITISFTGTGASSEFRPYKTGNANLECYGNDGDSFTFTAPSGKQFTKIEITDNDFIVFTEYGDWTKPELNKIEWNGTAASEVTLGGSNNTFASDLTSIVFTLADPEPEPEPEPAGDEITVTWNDPSGYGFEFTQDGVTLTCGEISSIDFYGPGTFTTDLGNFTKIEVYAEGGCFFDGDGWSGDINQKTWTGNAASVSFSDNIYALTSIVFTIEPAAAPEPEPEPAEEVTVVFAANDKNVERTVTLPHTFKCNANEGMENPDELDNIIVELYNDYYICQHNIQAPGSKVEAGMDQYYNDYITIEGVFEGTAIVTGDYMNHDGNQFPYTLIISIKGDEPEPEPAGQNYNLTLADGSNEHGSVAFSVGGNDASQAKKDDVVTVSVAPNDGYSAKDVSVRAYTSWEAASDILAGGNNLVSDIDVAKNNEDGTWFFTMPAANVWVVVSYSKNLQDSWIQAIDNQTYSGEAIEPAVEVMDGESVLVMNSDYTVAYSNNVNAGIATVTITAVEGSNYSGSASKTFEILKAANSWTTAPAAVEGLICSGEAQTLISAGEALFGTELYSLDGENYSEDLPQATNAGSYTVYYKAEGDANHNGIDAQSLNVTIAPDKSALNDAISDAEAYYNIIAESNPDIAATLLEAINAAKSVQSDDDATQSEVNDAIAALNNAKATAEAKCALNNIISEAEQYHNSISESNPDIAATLLDAINAAKSVLSDDDAMQSEVNAATQTLTDALNAAKAEVALKRITVVIPAKSYMARIDADKRQIEVAVEGVSLYSVQSVTSTEVILTEELSVIAAEMPYFIYNDNDVEMEVSLIVSNDDADDVDYDSEHFKGTLVDKTFTDEDMAAKDYYVLSDNSFVWVMNAGTLAAGKCWIELGKSPAHAPRLIIVSKGEATGISNIEAGSATKVLRDGQVLILRGDKTYTVQGTEIK